MSLTTGMLCPRNVCMCVQALCSVTQIHYGVLPSCEPLLCNFHPCYLSSSPSSFKAEHLQIRFSKSTNFIECSSHWVTFLTHWKTVTPKCVRTSRFLIRTVPAAVLCSSFSLSSVTVLTGMEESFRTGAKGIYHMEIFLFQCLSQNPLNWTIEGPLCRGNRKMAFGPNSVYTNLTKSTIDHVEKYHLENDCLPGLSIGFLPSFCSGSCEGHQGKLPPASTLDQALCPAAWD